MDCGGKDALLQVIHGMEVASNLTKRSYCLCAAHKKALVKPPRTGSYYCTMCSELGGFQRDKGIVRES